MDIEWKCDGCGQDLITDSKYAGAKVECPKCKKPLIIPNSETSREIEEKVISDAEKKIPYEEIIEDAKLPTSYRELKEEKQREVAIDAESFKEVTAKTQDQGLFPTKVVQAVDETGKVSQRLPSQNQKSYAAKFGTYGGMAGLAILFALPRMPNLMASFVVGAIVGGAGSLLGSALGSCIDVSHERILDHPNESNSEKAAVFSFVLGLACCLAWLLPIAGIPLSIIALLAGRAGRFSNNRGLSLAGMWIGIISLLLAVGNGLLGAMFYMLKNR